MFILLNLNAIMSVIFNVPAAIFSTVSPPSILDAMYANFASLQIVACRAVRRLNKFSQKGPEVL